MTATEPEKPGTAGLILCVEDEPDLRADIMDELRTAGHEAIGADDGRQALDILKTVRPDLILCDIFMPGMDGYELLHTMRTQRADLGDVPFVFLTALNERAEMISGKRSGADDYLVKPIDFDLMLASIEARITQARRMRALHSSQHAAAADNLGLGMTTEVLDLLGFGVVITCRQGSIAFANAYAHTVADETDSLLLGDRLRAGTTEQTRHLHACIAEAIDAGNSDDDSMRGLTVTRSDGGGELMLVICPLAGTDGQASRAAIFISDTARRPALPAHMLAALFGLTPAEAQVAHGLVSGRRRADIAAELNISQTTVAFHLRNLFEKTGTHRQADLVALFMKTLAAVK